MSAHRAKSSSTGKMPAYFPASHSRIPLIVAILFLALVMLGVYHWIGSVEYPLILMIAVLFGGYMALNIGANDVANNVAPAVGSRALTIVGALIIAAIFESAGALIAGGDVVETISKGIINPGALQDEKVFIVLMLSALLAAALWVNLATYLSAPVSTTHSIVGAVMGAGIAASGVSVVNWPTMAAIASSWIISPIMGGAIAALFYWAIRKLIFERADRIEASRFWVPIFVGLMASSFIVYLMMKGLKNIMHVDTLHLTLIGVLVFVLAPLLLRPYISRASKKLHNNSHDVNKLFTWPLIGSAALLSFAHGANDVANAVGPLAAIINMITEPNNVVQSVGIPPWVMLIGAVGISLGLLLFGASIVNTVGESITKLNQSRAYCVALSSAVTVIVATAFGLPVSSTHIAVGSIFGIGLYREFKNHNDRKRRKKEYEHTVIKRKLVRRRHLLSIMAAWVITVPSSSFIAALLYLLLSHLFIA